MENSQRKTVGKSINVSLTLWTWQRMQSIGGNMLVIQTTSYNYNTSATLTLQEQLNKKEKDHLGGVTFRENIYSDHNSNLFKCYLFERQINRVYPEKKIPLQQMSSRPNQFAPHS